MRNMVEMIPGGVPVVVGLILVSLLMSSMVPIRPQMWLYPLVRQAVVMKIDYQTQEMLAQETPHFIIRYTESDADMVAMVAQAAEAAYEPVTSALQYVPGSKTLILIYPDRQAMKQAYGWAGDASAMGFYWGGVIQILSPKVWMNRPELNEFIATGPLAHEYTHLVFDHMSRGNYSRWFTEGLAQYVEYRVNGYEWMTVDNQLTGKLYTMAELDRDFDNLSNQSLAYRQSLAAVRYIAEVHGDEALTQVMTYLAKGKKVPKAIEKSLGMDYATYEAMVNLWAQGNMKHYSQTAN